ncbi:hypothetical protein BD413DRAFT_72839 [Trametes elegans]|nr:hypothetical protein BD413DRAFT_72839 [Trametes elegans]
MWCTRWYLPLLLLPFPIAPPFYLVLWIFSISMHARPWSVHIVSTMDRQSDLACPSFYCMALLSTMYISLCYWPPVSIDTPLVRPWSPNITTFADALRYKLPDLPPEKVPDMMPIEEHCWCDTTNGAFAPVNLTRWEEASVNRLVESLQRDIAAEQELARRRRCEEQESEAKANGTSCADEHPVLPPRKGRRRKFPLLNLLDLFGLSPISPSTLPAYDPDEPATPPAQEAHTGGQPEPTTPPRAGSAKLPWFRREYDLRKFGFAMVLDFGWPSSQS